MKKTILFMALILVMGSGSAFAAQMTASSGQAITGQKGSQTAVAMGKLSNNVSLYVVYEPTAFAASTKHLSGNRTFSTSFDDTRIYWQSATVGATVGTGGITASDSSNYASGWESL